jgi:hypothetical protein
LQDQVFHFVRAPRWHQHRELFDDLCVYFSHLRSRSGSGLSQLRIREIL